MAVRCSSWRLSVAAVLGMLLIGLATPRPSPAQDGAEELLKNPGFDQELDGQGLPRDWSVTRDRVLWREAVYLSKNYELVSRPDAYVLATQSIRLKPGQRYTIRLTLKGEGGALGGALIVHGEQKPSREMPLLVEHPAVGRVRDVRRHVRGPESGGPVADLQRRPQRDDRLRPGLAPRRRAGRADHQPTVAARDRSAAGRSARNAAHRLGHAAGRRTRQDLFHAADLPLACATRSTWPSASISITT